MAKTVRDSRLDSRAAREKLKPSGKPYFRDLEPNLHLGYRKGKHGGKWVMRRYVGDERYVVETIGARRRLRGRGRRRDPDIPSGADEGARAGAVARRGSADCEHGAGDYRARRRSRNI